MKFIITLLFLGIVNFSFSQNTSSSNKEANKKIYRYNKKKISQNNYFYFYTDGGLTGKKSALYILHPQRSFWGTVTETGSVIFVKQDSRDIAVNQAVIFDTIQKIELIKDPTGSLVDNAGRLYFSEEFFPKIPIKEALLPENDLIYKKLNRIKYSDYKFVLQAMAVPLKFRKGVDTIPYTTETSVNVGFGAGIKFGLNWYSANKSFLGQKTNTLSFTPGLLFGLGAADIKGKVTASATFKDRKEPIFSYGLFFMTGFNNINIGFIIGKDMALKDGGKAGGWVYNKKTWTGIAIGLDIIK